MSLDDYDTDQWETTSFRRARKEHVCCACKETITRTHRYHRSVIGSDGTINVFIHCLRCRAICEALWKHGAGVIDMELNCGHTWEEADHSDGQAPPTEVLRLAFMTQDEAQRELGYRKP